MKRAALLVPLIAAGLPALASADLRLPAVLGDHMVLQRSSRVPLWGWAEPGEAVSVSASWGATAWTRADGQGRWRVELDTPPAGGPHTIELRGNDRLVLEDVLSGEVWVCGGQSNMEWSLARLPMDAPGVEEATRADLPRMRLFDVAHAVAPAPREDCDGAWRACTPESVRDFSVVGFFFGRELLRELDVPVGLVGCNWGGTVAEAWTSAETLADFPEFRPVLEDVALLADQPEAGERELAWRRAEWWSTLGEHDPGSSDAAWSRPGFDDSDWDAMDLPRAWESGGLDGFDGLVWFRRDVVVPERWAGRELLVELGPIDDMDTAWFDGVRIGGLERPGVWRTPRAYRVPAELATAGRHVLAVRALDTGGAGGMTGETDQLQVAPAEDAEGLHLPLSGSWRYRPGASLAQLPRFPDRPSFHQNVATALSNGMLAPIVPYGIRGAIWYQGESNRTRAKQYERLFPAMIADWRARWGRGDFPFYFVQIAPFGYGGDTGQAAELRDAQRKSLAVPNTGMAVTMDIGEPGDIHPKNKLDVGRRLARWALARTYGKQDLVCSGPLYRSMSFEGDAIRIEFDHVDGGLVARGGELTHFTIAGPDRRFAPAVARIDGRGVLVSSPNVPRPVAVRYGWGAADQPNLFNAAGLPASSFRTDDWPR